jgi:hypothetical protein
MMGGVSPETCWASYKYGTIKFDTLLHYVGSFFMNRTMMNGLTNLKFNSFSHIVIPCSVFLDKLVAFGLLGILFPKYCNRGAYSKILPSNCTLPHCMFSPHNLLSIYLTQFIPTCYTWYGRYLNRKTSITQSGRGTNITCNTTNYVIIIVILLILIEM